MCKVMVWFAHVADGAELKESWSSEENVPRVNASHFHFCKFYLQLMALSPFCPVTAAVQFVSTNVSFLCIHIAP